LLQAFGFIVDEEEPDLFIGEYSEILGEEPVSVDYDTFRSIRQTKRDN